MVETVDDQVIAVPKRARPVIDAYGQRIAPQAPSGVRALPLRVKRGVEELLKARH